MKPLIIDLETTGLPPKNANYETDFMQFPYIVKLAYKVGGDETKEFIINQEGRNIPPETIEIHGVTDEMAAASPHKIVDVLRLLLSEAADTTLTVGHSIYFDSSTIKANALREIAEGRTDENLYELLKVILHKDRRIDTMKASTKLCNLPGPRGLKYPKLGELHEKLFPGEKIELHNGKGCVDATARCFDKLIELGVITIGSKEA